MTSQGPEKHGPHPFWLVRDYDVSGISGIGIVAEGVQFSDGTTILRWLPRGTRRPDKVKPTTVVHESVDSVIALHGHDGKTWVQFADSVVWPPENEGRPTGLLGNKGGLDELEEADNDEEQDG